MLNGLYTDNLLNLKARFLKIEDVDTEIALEFLRYIYNKEVVEYPYSPPPFDEKAALWASKILFYFAQLTIHRDQEISQLGDLLAAYTGEKTESAILSADLSLRFLPQIIQILESIHIEDEAIHLILKILHNWHYSGLFHHLDARKIHFTEIYHLPCLQTLYVDRVIEQKRLQIAHLKPIKPLVTSALGYYSSTFWKEFNSSK